MTRRACPETAVPVSKARPFAPYRASGVQWEVARPANGSPSGGNGDDRRQWRKQGGAVGAAASRMQATAKQTLGAATRPWRAKARLRGQARRERTAHAAISRLFVSAMLSPRPQITVSILALSVTFGDTSPRGRGFVRTGKVCKNCKTPLQTSPRCGIIHLAASPLEIEYLPL